MPAVEGGGCSHAGGPPPIVGSADATESYHTAAAKADPDLTLSHPDVNDPASAPGSQGAVAMDGLPPRYEKLGEVGRGGMGKVLWCRDIELERELAVKVLRPEHYNNADITRRFVAEARIVAQLQHPGIAPVHEVGYTAGGWPYFTMKLVRGRTLEALLRDRSNPAAEWPRFLTFFEHVCQTVAYAHNRGVVHRDLKPGNVMVGAFGEVQVMDWGLSKVLDHGDAGLDPPVSPLEAEGPVYRPLNDLHETGHGWVAGTPAYMAPEQARGEIDWVDERADVFGLGSILCEILTGFPPYTGPTSDVIRHKAAAADLSDALARLDACGADSELLTLARCCLAAQPVDRPRRAATLAEALAAHFASVEERLRAAESAKFEAEVKAAEEAKRRMLNDAFIQVATQELNTPITLIIGLTEQLKLANPDLAADEREILRQITASGRQLSRLVTSMMTLARADELRRTVQRSPVVLSGLIEGVVDQVRPFIRARQLHLHMAMAEDLGTFEIDPDKINAVLVNLLTNAIKFTPDQGHISVSADLGEEGDARIVVEDRGVGLEPQALEHLFQPFFTQFDPSRHSSGDFGFCKRGLGLGLSISKVFVEMHGGQITAESVPAGGTRITVHLPRRNETGQDGEEPRQPHRNRPTRCP